MNYCTAEDPENPGERINRLSRYAAQYWFPGTAHTMDGNEKARFKEEILLASYTFIKRAQELTSTTDEDLRQEKTGPEE